SLLSGGNTTSRYAVIHSDIIDGKIEGQYNIGDVPAALYSLAAKTMPELFPERQPEIDTDCNISINMTLRENATTNNWLSFFKSPVKVLYPVTVKADFSNKEQILTASIEAPYLMQKDKFIDNTALHISVDGDSRQIVANAVTTFPTKHGATNMSIDMNYAEGVSDVGTHWQVESPRRYEGRLSLTGEAARSTTGELYADIAVNRTTAIMNDTTWIINPSEISYHANVLTINNFEISRDKQFIRIDGMASNNPLDRIVLQLQDIDLDYVFEALAIPTAMFGGTATGDFYASEIFSKTPVLYTPQLYVQGFKYNSALLGDASIQSAWNPDTQGITILADIVSDQSRHSSVDGVIYPTRSSLDFKFDTDSINIAFLRPFMAAFTSEVKGHASGHAHLYGTFADVNLTGDIFAQDFTLKIDYTNTQYHVTDSIHITPGRIEFDNLTIKDDYGNSAKFNGYLGHNYFHDPWFEFKLSEARNLLCYDITPEINPDWYGRVFCNGTAYVKGVP
ncbi:MAG: hypothetical protein K2M98_09030, partial [Muribaculum sp.]|nr:hypothetical protein [Muribaculum sp.]